MTSPRRRLILRAAGVAAALSMAPRALGERRVRLLGYLSPLGDSKPLAKALAAHGYVEGDNLRIELRVSQTIDPERAAKAAELVRLRPDVLVAQAYRLTAALFAATKVIPIVTGGTLDPVGSGFARTLARPGLNVTGLASGWFENLRKLAELTRLALPRLSRMRVVLQMEGGMTGRLLREAVEQAGLQPVLVPLRNVDDDLRSALREIRDPATEAMMLVPHNELDVRHISALVVRHRVALVGAGGEWLARAGCLLAHSYAHSDPLARVAGLVDKILRGADPAGIPFEMPDRNELVVNRSTASALGLRLSPEILARATQIVD